MKDEKSIIDLFAERIGKKRKVAQAEPSIEEEKKKEEDEGIVTDIENAIDEIPSEIEEKPEEEGSDISDKVEELKDSIIQSIRDIAKTHDLLTSEVIDIIDSLFSDKDAVKELKLEVSEEKPEEEIVEEESSEEKTPEEEE